MPLYYIEKGKIIMFVKNKKISGLFIFILVFVLCSGCAVKEKERKTEETTEALSEGFTVRCGTSEQPDGWLYMLEISYGADGVMGYYFEAFHEKYEKMEGFTVKVIGEHGEIVNEIAPDCGVTMCLNDDYNMDLNAVEAFLKEKKFTEEINLDSLEGLELDILDKQVVVDTFNNAITAEMRTELGPFKGHSNAYLYVGKENKGKKWQAFVFNSYGYIDKVKIDCVTDGKYFSDKSKKELTKEEKKLKKDMELIEQWMQEEDGFPLQHKAKELNSKEGKELLNFIKTMDNEEIDEESDKEVHLEPYTEENSK